LIIPPKTTGLIPFIAGCIDGSLGVRALMMVQTYVKFKVVGFF
jgi:hypothetical protein